VDEVQYRTATNIQSFTRPAVTGQLGHNAAHLPKHERERGVDETQEQKRTKNKEKKAKGKKRKNPNRK
jgi:hypothetical protein